MKTRTIYQALDCVREQSAFFATEKRVRQAGAFERELLRRMDERDAMVSDALVAEAVTTLSSANFINGIDGLPDNLTGAALARAKSLLAQLRGMP